MVDAREQRFLADAPRIVEDLRRKGADVTVLFFDSSDESLIRRYSETRRRHPLAGDSGSVPEGIAAERKALAGLRAVADEVVDTTRLNVHELKRLVHNRFVGAGADAMGVTLVSFGFRTGIPAHADLVLDVRFLPNPYFVPELKPFPGTEPRVRDFVLGQEDAQRFLEKAEDLAGFLIPRYRAEGKTYLTVAIGCTGGRHRSVAIADRAGGPARQARHPGPGLAPRRRQGVNDHDRGGDRDARPARRRRPWPAPRGSSGRCPRARAVSVSSALPLDAAREAIAAAIREVEEGDGVLVLTDMLGGTPANLALGFLGDRVDVITGVNLPMLLKLSTCRTPEARLGRRGPPHLRLRPEERHAGERPAPAQGRRRPGGGGGSA